MRNKMLFKKLMVSTLAVATLVTSVPTYASATEVEVMDIMEATEEAVEEVATEEAVEEVAEAITVEATDDTTDDTTEDTVTNEVKTVAINMGVEKSELSFTWLATSGDASYVEITTLDGTKVATVEAAQSDYTSAISYYSYSVTVNCFDTVQTYKYRVGNEAAWSEWSEVTIGEDDGAYSFLAAGDPQIGSSKNGVEADGDGWETTLDLATEWFGEELNFLVSVGDQVNASRTTYAEAEYDEFFAPELLSSLPMMINMGNHEAYTYSTFSAHYTSPSTVDTATTSSVAGTESGDYWFDYEGTLFVSLNSNDSSIAEHQEFMNNAIEEYTATYGEPTWQIVAFHHSIYSSASHYNDSDVVALRNGLAEYFSEVGIDLVLMGHDHVYTRSELMQGMNPVATEDSDTLTPEEGEVMYVTLNSASGSKFYSVQNYALEYAAVINQENQANITKVDVTDTSITVTTYRTGETSTEEDIVDQFTLVKETTDTDVDTDTETETTIKTTEYPAIPLESVAGEYNDVNELNADLISGFSVGDSDDDGGLVEIVVYNEDAKVAYATSGSTGELLVIDMAELTTDGLSGVGYNMEDLVGEIDGFVYGDMSSVSVNDDNTYIAVAIQAEDYTANGMVAFFALDSDGNIIGEPTFVECGVQPDALTFTPDGTKVLVANEGEPREGYGDGVVDPEGSVTIVDVTTMTGNTVNFDNVTIDSEVLIKTGATVSQDLEPEFISTTDTVAYVALQENNAIAVLDLATATFTGVYSLGFIDYSEVAIDINKDDEAYDSTTYENLYGIRMPDGISIYEIDGITYLYTANEGDGREWGEEDSENFYCNEEKSKTSPTGNIVLDGKVTWFVSDDYTMLDSEADYLFGGRSFSIFEVTDSGLELVYDSGEDFSSIVAEVNPEYFNCSNDDISVEDRTGKKGVEPEYTVAGVVDGEVYAFTGLERQGGIMIYNVTDAENAYFVNYIDSRDYSADIAGDVAPEGLYFVNAEESSTGNALLLVANEVSGTMSVIELTSYLAPDVDTDEDVDDNTQTEVTLTETEVKLTVSNATANTIKLSWTAVEDAEGYVIYGKTASGSYGYKAMTTSTSWTDSSASAEELNYYWVYPYYKNVEDKMVIYTENASAVSAIATTEVLEAVARPTAKSVSQGVQLTWTAVEGADGYAIYSKVNGKDVFKFETITSNTTWTDMDVSSLEYSFYWVMPYTKNADGTCNVMTAGASYTYGKALLVSPVSNIKPTSKSYGLQLTWDAVDGVDGYVIYGRVAGGAYEYQYITSNTSWVGLDASAEAYNFYWVYPYVKLADGTVEITTTGATYTYGRSL